MSTVSMFYKSLEIKMNVNLLYIIGEFFTEFEILRL